MKSVKETEIEISKQETEVDLVEVMTGSVTIFYNPWPGVIRPLQRSEQASFRPLAVNRAWDTGTGVEIKQPAKKNWICQKLSESIDCGWVFSG